MVYPENWKYIKSRKEIGGNLPHFSDFNDPRYQFMQNKIKMTNLAYFQWLHCCGTWGEEHSMCKKMRWYVEEMMIDFWLEKWDLRKSLGEFDYITLYGAIPCRGFIPMYQPVKKNRPGAYEFWRDRDFEPLYSADVADWKEKAPILHDVFVHGKKPIYDPKPDK